MSEAAAPKKSTPGIGHNQGPHLSPHDEQGKVNFLADYLDLGRFAADVNRDPRTVLRWMAMPNGLPFVRLGNRRLIHIEMARQWLFARMRHPSPRRGSKRKAGGDEPMSATAPIAAVAGPSGRSPRRR